MNPSGRSGAVGQIADWWDRKPVTGVVLALTVAGGTVAAFLNGGASPGVCDTDPLIHVYNPKRLVVIEKCAEVSGTIVKSTREHDGDYHVNMVMNEDGWTNAANVRGQHGATVVEFVPLGPKFPPLKAGMRLKLTGTKVYDQQHKRKVEEFGWIEMHPVFKVEVLP